MLLLPYNIWFFADNALDWLATHGVLLPPNYSIAIIEHRIWSKVHLRIYIRPYCAQRCATCRSWHAIQRLLRKYWKDFCCWSNQSMLKPSYLIWRLRQPDSQEQEAIYNFLLILQAELVKIIKDGITSREAYQHALSFVKVKKPELEKHFVKSLGFGVTYSFHFEHSN